MSALKFYLETLLKVLPRVVPLLAFFVLPNYKSAFIVIYLVLFTASEYYSVAKPEKKLRDRTAKILDSHFRPWIEGAKYRWVKPNLRVNVMLLSLWRVRIHRMAVAMNAWFGKTSARLVRLDLFPIWLLRAIEPRFVQYYQYGMTGHPDANLNLRSTTGFCGRCFELGAKRTYYVDMRTLKPEEISREHNLGPGELKTTSHITAITCTTLMRKRERLFGRELPEDEYFGVLNIDSADGLGAEFLGQQKVLTTIEAFGVIVQEIYE